MQKTVRMVEIAKWKDAQSDDGDQGNQA